MYAHSYFDGCNKPLKNCPFCHADLTLEDNVLLEAVVNEKQVDCRTHLLNDGSLVDVDKLVANGYHGGTCCGICGELLIASTDVEERCLADTN